MLLQRKSSSKKRIFGCGVRFLVMLKVQLGRHKGDSSIGASSHSGAHIPQSTYSVSGTSQNISSMRTSFNLEKPHLKFTENWDPFLAPLGALECYHDCHLGSNGELLSLSCSVKV